MSLLSIYQSGRQISEEFLIVKWSISKIYTLIENQKYAKLNSIVTCNINYIKDIGEVIFIGKNNSSNSNA